MNATLELILTIIDVLCCIALTVIVLCQSGKGEGMPGALGGAAETFFGQNKGRSLDAKLERLTVIIAIVFVVVTFVLSIF